MQTHPWEPWDLLQVLGEGGAWLADFSRVRHFYEAVAGVQQGSCDLETARKAAALVAADPHFPSFPGDPAIPSDRESLANRLAFAAPTQRDNLAHWLRQGSPFGETNAPQSTPDSSTILRVGSALRCPTPPTR